MAPVPSGSDTTSLASERRPPILPLALIAALLRTRLRSARLFVLLAASLSLVLSLPLFFEESLLQMAWRLWFARQAVGPVEGTITLSVMMSVVASRGLLRPARRTAPVPTDTDIARAVEILGRQPNASAGLVRLGDKQVLFSDCGTAFIMYARRGRSMIALFDPVGPRAAWASLVLKFVAEARAQRCRPIFYQVSPDFLPIAVEARLTALKLGEQAVVNLEQFTLAGGEWLKLRRAINRAERDGLVFEMLQPSDVPAVIDELAEVSNAWLAAHNSGEKGFSLGTFDRAYVASEPVAVIRLDGRIVAFANVLTTASGGDAFIDLMRHVPGVHRGMMDLLFTRIMGDLKARGFRSLNLGMAPLAGLATHSRAPVWNHLGRQIFEAGERFYNFRGVLAFKSKFDPNWQPRYLVVAGRGFPLAGLLDVTLLIGGGLRSVLKK